MIGVAHEVGRTQIAVGSLHHTLEHGITLEKTLPRTAGAERAVRCVGGRRADVPAEDIGGVWGLAEVLQSLDTPGGAGSGPHGELVAELRAAGYDPAAFDRDGITARAEVGTAPRTQAAGPACPGSTPRGLDREDLGAVRRHPGVAAADAIRFATLR